MASYLLMFNNYQFQYLPCDSDNLALRRKDETGLHRKGETEFN